MNLEDRLPAPAVRAVDQHLPIDSSRPQQCRIENFRPIGRGQQHYAFARIETVQLREQLIEGLLLLVIATEGADAAHLAQRIELIDKDDAGRSLARLLKQIVDPRGTDADEHFHELRPRDREKRHAGFTGDSLGHKRLARAGRADQQRPLGNVRAEAGVAGLVLQKGNDFHQFKLRFIDSGNIGEGDAGIPFDKHLGPGFADTHQAPQALFFGETAERKVPGRHDQHQWQQPAQQPTEQGVLIDAAEPDPRLRQVRGQRRIYPLGGEQFAAIDGLKQFPTDPVFLYLQIADFLLGHQLQELTVRNALHGMTFGGQKLHEGQHQECDQEIREVPLIIVFHGHGPTRTFTPAADGLRPC
ncbi:hypothetical protein FBY04_109157 [Pseudomonas sp. SJZ080]|nr:hypothetical protein FBY04_109157 [Pseudomonas sp. SJZ080]